jgi:putative ABC transport system permease protein
MFRIALKNVLARKLRLVTSGIAVILGVSFMAGGLVLTDTINHTFDVLFADVFAGTDTVVRSSVEIKSDFRDSARGRVPAELVAKVQAVAGVARAEGVVFQPGARVLGTDGKPVGPSQGPPRFGTNWSDDRDLSAWRLSAGRAPKASGEVVIDKKTAQDGKIAAGDRTTVVTPGGTEKVTVVGIARFGDVDTAGGAGFVFFPTEQAQRLMGQPGTFDSINAVAVKGVSEDELTQRVAATLPKGEEALTGTEITKENQDSIKQNLAFFGVFLKVFAYISLFVGAFIIYNTFSILVAQRRREMALLRAMGATSRQVLGTLMAEALAVAVVASVLGLFAGIGMAGLLKTVLSGFGLDLPASGVVVTGGTVIASLLVGIIITLLAAFLPARRGGKVPPIAALRETAVDTTELSKLRVGVSVGITALGALLLGFGLAGDGSIGAVGLGALVMFIGVTTLGPVVARPVTRILGAPFDRWGGFPGSLGRQNAMRNPKRTARTASALLIGVALVGFIAIMTTSVKASFEKVITEQFTGDFVIGGGAGGDFGFTTELGDRLAKLPEVGDVAPLRFAPARLDGKDTGLTGIAAEAGARLFKLELVDGTFDLGPDGIAVTAAEAKKRAWSLGDELPVTYTQGGERSLRVAAIFTSPTDVSPLTPMFVDVAALEAAGGPQSDQTLFVSVAKGTSFDTARTAVERVAKDYPTIEVQGRKEFARDTASVIDPLVALIYVFLALSVFIALFGIANTLVLSVLERIRELGVLRAVGMTKRQVRAAVRYEAVIVSLFGTLGGLGLGAFFAWAVVQAISDNGLDVFKIPVGTIAVITVIAALAGVVAAIVPARRAARLDILQAIATE